MANQVKMVRLDLAFLIIQF